jgi:large subunit ribosomal protein L35Ae
MEGRVSNYRNADSTRNPRHIIIHVDGIGNREKAKALVGKKAVWKSVKAVISGKVASAHGNSGAVRVIFERGLPGPPWPEPG